LKPEDTLVSSWDNKTLGSFIGGAGVLAVQFFVRFFNGIPFEIALINGGELLVKRNC
jgi:hypothetical protein